MTFGAGLVRRLLKKYSQTLREWSILRRFVREEYVIIRCYCEETILIKDIGNELGTECPESCIYDFQSFDLVFCFAEAKL